jgi:3-hydroxyacyl-[acyl-carrier-protein] dehydratase
MPGLLQVEALAQLGALIVLTMPGNKGKVLYLSSANKLKFLRKVLPGDRFTMEVSLTGWKRGIGVFAGTGKVAGQVACQAEFVLVLPDALDQFKVKVD